MPRLQPRASALPSSIMPRGMCREEAAWYLGISPAKFDQIVADGRMPKGFLIDRCRVWDRHRLDAAFEILEALAEQEETSERWRVAV